MREDDILKWSFLLLEMHPFLQMWAQHTTAVNDAPKKKPENVCAGYLAFVFLLWMRIRINSETHSEE